MNKNLKKHYFNEECLTRQLTSILVHKVIDYKQLKQTKTIKRIVGGGKVKLYILPRHFCP